LDVLAERAAAGAEAVARGQRNFFADDVGGDEIADELTHSTLQLAAACADARLTLALGEAPLPCIRQCIGKQVAQDAAQAQLPAWRELDDQLAGLPAGLRRDGMRSRHGECDVPRATPLVHHPSDRGTEAQKLPVVSIFPAFACRGVMYFPVIMSL
jgi:hypothetical protein